MIVRVSVVRVSVVHLHAWMAKLGLISRALEADQIFQLLGDERCARHSH